MPHYAHVHLEDPRTDRKYAPGDVVPDDLPGLAELQEFASVGSSPPERRVVALSDGTVIREIDSAGIENRTKHVKRFDGDTFIDAVQPAKTVVDPADSAAVED
jgi:hypothetical protein